MSDRTSLYVDGETRERVEAAAEDIKQAYGLKRFSQVNLIRMALDLLKLPELAEYIQQWIDKNIKE